MGIEERLERIERLLVMNTKQVLNTAEVAIFLNISEGRVRHLTCDRELPYYKSGGRVFFKRSEIEEWMLKEKIPTNEETSVEAMTRMAIEKLKNR